MSASIGKISLALLLGLGIGFGVSTWLAKGPASGPVPHEKARTATERALGEFDRLERIEALAALLPRIGPEGLDGVLDAYREAPLNGGDAEFLLLVSWWGAFAPEAARRWADDDLRVGGYLLVLEELFRKWGQQNPEPALEEALGIRFSFRRRACTAAVLLGAADTERGELAALLGRIPSGSERQEILTAVMSARPRADRPESRIERARQLASQAGSDSELIVDILIGALMAVAKEDPPAAGRWWRDEVGSRIPPSAGLPREIGVTWTRQDPEAAMTWLESLPAGPDRDDAVLHSYRQWMGQDYPAAMAWLEPHLAAPPRALEPAIGARALSVSAERPLDGLAEAGTITDPAIREETETTILVMWIVRDPETAGPWLETADLPAEHKADLRARAVTWRTGTPRQAAPGSKRPGGAPDAPR